MGGAAAGCGDVASRHAEPNIGPKYHFRAAYCQPWNQPGIRGLSVTTGHDNSEASVSILTSAGTHGRIRSRTNTRFYYVLEGSVTFEVDGQKFGAEKDDAIVIPRGAPYNLWSPNAKLLLFPVPAFDPSGDFPA
jgi:mannose-6-phosphate isomerase-like protein (cupin superfamily)